MLSGNAKAALASEVPIDSLGADHAGDIPAKVTFEGRLPRNEVESKAVFDHGKPSRCEVHSFAVDPGYRGARRSGAILKFRFTANDRGRCGIEVSPAKRLDKLSGEANALAVPPRQPFRSYGLLPTEWVKTGEIS